jgi:hypothetical protein
VLVLVLREVVGGERKGSVGSLRNWGRDPGDVGLSLAYIVQQRMFVSQ